MEMTNHTILRPRSVAATHTSFFVPYEPDRFSEQEAWDWITKVRRREFADVFYVDFLDALGWT